MTRSATGNPSPSPRIIRVGAMTGAWDGTDLRNLRLGDREVVRRVYVAVRDENWQTLPAVVRSSTVTAEGDRTVLEAVATHGARAARVETHTRMILTPEDELIVSFVAQALGDISYNRMGICLLHPPAVGEGDFTWTGAGGRVRRGQLGRSIVPQSIDDDGLLSPALGPFTELELSPADGIVARTVFTGDEFETEDQRNWTDASFKTYSTPIRLPTPQRLRAGGTIRQSAHTWLRGHPAAGSPATPTWHATGATVGSVGTCLIATPPPSAEHIATLAEFHPGHYRVVGVPTSDVGVARLRADLHMVRELAAELELELRLPTPVSDATRLDEAVEAAVRAVADAGLAAPSRVLALVDGGPAGSAQEVSPPGLVAEVARRLADRWPTTVVGGGTPHHFCQANRRREALRGLPLVTFPLVPTMHAQDEQSILETPSVIGDLVATAAEVFPGSALSVGPISLTHGSTAPDAPVPDSRCETPLAAAWLLGVLAPLFGAATTAMTALDVRPGHGLITVDGAPTPALAVLAEFARCRGAEVLRVDGYDPLQVAGIGVLRDGITTLYVVNLASETREIDLPDGDIIEAAALVGTRWHSLDKGLRRPIPLAAHAIARIRFHAHCQAGTEAHPSRPVGAAEPRHRR